MNPMTIAQAFRILVASFIILKNNIKRDFFSSALTILLGLFVYTVSQIAAENWSVKAGVLRAYWLSDEDKAVQARDKHVVAMQDELRVIEQSNAIIQTRLNQLLIQIRSAARVRVVVMHNSAYSLAGVGLLRFDITHGAAKPGRSVGDFAANQPMSQMSDYLAPLLKGECAVVSVANLTDVVAVARLKAMNTMGFIACPVINTRTQILGVLFASWDEGDTFPADPAAVIAAMHDATITIAVALDLRPSITGK